MKKLIVGSMVFLSLGLAPVRAEVPRTLPPAAYAQMKKGKKLDQVWISPNYNVASGFRLGKTSSLAVGQFISTADYLPYAFGRLALPFSTNVLSLALVRLDTLERSNRSNFRATVQIEGQVVDKDGQLMMAFYTQETSTTWDAVIPNCKAAMDKVVLNLAKELGEPFQKAMGVKTEIAGGSGLVPPPPAPEPSLDMAGRLLRLEDLYKKGLITPEEYKAHKEELLKNL